LKIENPQAPAFIRGVNLKSQISNLKSIDRTQKRILAFWQESWRGKNFRLLFNLLDSSVQ